MTDAALRQQIAQWTRAALGELMEDDGALEGIGPVVERTTCCIVGSGPAGAMLALLLARQGIAVTLLEAQTDFDRDFRGDALQASALEILNELGLADRLLRICHTKISRLSIPTDAHHYISIDLTRLHTQYPYMTLLPHTDLLDVVLTEAKRYPTFRLIMGAHVEGLIKEVVSNKPFKRPLSTSLLLHLPGIDTLSARILALGVHRVHIKQ